MCHTNFITSHDLTSPPAVSADPSTAAWEITSAAIAGRPRVRLAETRGTRISYPARAERDLACTLPARPAAVMISDALGCARTLCIDLDAHEHTSAEVQADYLTLRPLLEDAGLPVFADAAHGGIHVYALIDPISMADAREIVGALARRFPTLDLRPYATGDQQRCITTPGTAHKLGGHRTLIDPVENVRQVVAGPRGDLKALTMLRAVLCEELDAYRAELLEKGREEARADEGLVLPDTITDTGRVSLRIDALARSGDHLAAGYRTPSEGVAAVLCGAVDAGMTQSHVRALINERTWVGLRRLLDHKEKGRLAYEWKRAREYIGKREAEKAAGQRTEESVHRSDTHVTYTHRGVAPAASKRERSAAELHRLVRTWRSTLHQVERIDFPGTTGWKHGMVLRVLAGMAHRKVSPAMAVGVRALSLETGLSHETVSQVLQDLRADLDPWVVRLERAHGRDADTYELRIPHRHQDTAERVRWLRGKSWGVRSVFWELGIPAALVFEAVEQGYAGSVEQTMLRTGLSRAATYNAIQILMGWRLIKADDEEYQAVAGEKELDRLARHLGTHSIYLERLRLYRKQRKIWHDWLLEAAARREAEQAGDDPMLVPENKVMSEEWEWFSWWEALARGAPQRQQSVSVVS